MTSFMAGTAPAPYCWGWGVFRPLHRGSCPTRETTKEVSHLKAVIQRTKSASVTIDGEVVGQIGQGLLILLGICPADTPSQAQFLAEKLANLRIFPDEEGKLNRSLLEVEGQALVVSNFTLYGNCRKGRRPSFVGAARPEVAIPLYEQFMENLKQAGVQKVDHGEFGADMQVSLVNDGPVTLVVDTDEIMPQHSK